MGNPGVSREPRVLFLDEPTVGLDTRIRYELLDRRSVLIHAKLRTMTQR